MRGILLSILLALLPAFFLPGCGGQVKPILQETRLDVPSRVAMQKKRIKYSLIAGEITKTEAAPLRDDLDRISEKYEHLKAEGGPTEKETASLSRMLDEISARIFEASQLRKKQHRW